MALLCKECGTTVPEGQSICPRCRSLDLVVVKDRAGRPRPGEDSIEAYHRHQRRRRLAMLATAVTSVALMVGAIALAAVMKDIIPAGYGGSFGGTTAGESFNLLTSIRAALFFAVWNPILLMGAALILGLFSFRVWYRAFTGEAAATEFSVLDALAGKTSAKK